jgi:O-antigen/teichoic acid export membrane protein
MLLVIFTAEVAPSMVLAANLGMLQRDRRYFWVGVLGVVNTGFRVVAAASALWFGYRLAAVGILEGVAAWVTWLMSRAVVRHAPLESAQSESWQIILGTALVGIINVLFAVVDGLAAKYALNPAVAGRYNGLAIIGHSLQFLSASMSTVMLTAMLADPVRRYQYLLLTVGGYGIIAALGEWIFAAYGPALVNVVLGPEFLAIVPWIPYYGWGMMSLGFLNIAMLYSVARNRWEVIMTSGLGLIYWTWALVHDHSFIAFVVTTTLIATAGVLVLGQLVEQHIKVRPDPS